MVEQRKLTKKLRELGIMLKNPNNYTQDEFDNIKKDIKILKEKRKKEVENEIIQRFKTMKPFQNQDDIPDIPVIDKEIYESIIVPNLIRCGAIPKKDLAIGATYIGDTRNATKAKWNGKQFVYQRYKWGTYFEDECNHFEDDDGYAVFVPIKRIEDEKDK